MSKIYEFEVDDINGNKISLNHFKNKVLLIVNTASKCGFTPQYEGLELLREKYKDQGFEVLGFPCNQFGAQEPGNESEIQQFCQTQYNIHFPMFSKVDVNGDHAHPLYDYLKNEAPGLMGTKAIKWNFTKFLVSKDGLKVVRFSPQTKPSDLEEEIERII